MAKLPTNLINEFATLTDRMEQAIRDDERATVLRELNQRQQEAAQRFLAAIFEDRNGETSSLNLGDSAAKKLRQRRGFHADSKLGKLYRCLAYRSYPVTKNTLIRESGMTPLSFPKAIQTLRRKGYKIEALSGYGIKRRYKLAS
jgi:biotin operon repressor